METFRVAKTCDNAVIPARASVGAAGYDLSAAEPCVIPSGEYKMINTGIAVQVPSTHYARIAPRSGLAAKYGIDVFAGVIDSDYTGTVRVILMNNGKNDLIVNAGDRVAQMIFERISTPVLEEVEYAQLSATERGAGGFGSTGV